MRVRRRPEPVSDRVWSRLTPRSGLPAADSELTGGDSQPGDGGDRRDRDSTPDRDITPDHGDHGDRDDIVDGPDGPDSHGQHDWLPERPVPGERADRGERGARAKRQVRGGRGARDERADRGRQRITVEVPERLRTGEWVPSRRAALGLLLAVAIAALVFGGRWAMAVAGDAPRLVRTVEGSGADPKAGGAGAPGAAASPRASSPTSGPGSGPGSSAGVGGVGTAASAASDAAVVVDVVGRVASPGLVRLPAGSRVADAIAAAGGALGEADLQALNQARLLVDGEQIRVPAPGEVLSQPPSAPGAGGAPTGGGQSGSAPGGRALVSLNSADVATLDGLPGVGPVLAQRIVDWRTQHGRFTAVDELGEVSGIGDKLLGQLRPLVTL